jgi:hypothetical protein
VQNHTLHNGSLPCRIRCAKPALGSFLRFRCSSTTRDANERDRTSAGNDLRVVSQFGSRLGRPSNQAENFKLAKADGLGGMARSGYGDCRPVVRSTVLAPNEVMVGSSSRGMGRLRQGACRVRSPWSAFVVMILYIQNNTTPQK